MGPWPEVRRREQLATSRLERYTIRVLAASTSRSDQKLGQGCVRRIPRNRNERGRYDRGTMDGDRRPGSAVAGSVDNHNILIYTHPRARGCHSRFKSTHASEPKGLRRARRLRVRRTGDKAVPDEGRDAEHECPAHERVRLEWQRERRLAVLHQVAERSGEQHQLAGEQRSGDHGLRDHCRRRRSGFAGLTGLTLGLERVQFGDGPAVGEGDEQRGDAHRRVSEEGEPRLERHEEAYVGRVVEEMVRACCHS